MKLKKDKKAPRQARTGKPKKVELDKNANIAEVVFKYPKAAEVFAAFGLHCVSCFASQFDTIEQGAKLHGMIAEEAEEMIEEANKIINKEEDYDTTE